MLWVIDEDLAMHLVLKLETLDILHSATAINGSYLATNSVMISTLLDLSGTKAELIKFNLIILW